VRFSAAFLPSLVDPLRVLSDRTPSAIARFNLMASSNGMMMFRAFVLGDRVSR